MKDKLLKPVVFNVITIVAMLFALAQLVIGAPGALPERLRPSGCLKSLPKEVS